MTAERQDILEDFYEGDTKNLLCTIRSQDGSLKDLSQSELVYALIRDDAKNPQTLFLKSSLSASEIEVLALGYCVVHLLPGDTFNRNGIFRHQLLVVDENDNASMAMTGKVQIFRAFAKRPRSSGISAFLSA